MMRPDAPLSNTSASEGGRETAGRLKLYGLFSSAGDGAAGGIWAKGVDVLG